GGLAAVVAVAEGAVGVEGHASVGRVAELGGGEGVGLGVRVVGEDAGGGAVAHCDRAATGPGGAVVVGDRRVVDGRDRNRDGGCGAALVFGHWRRARAVVVFPTRRSSDLGGLAAVVAVAEGAVGVEGHAPVHGVAELRRGEGVALGVRVVGEDAGGRAVEDCDRAALGHGGAVVVGGRRVVDRRDRNRDRGRVRVERAVVRLVGERVGAVVVHEWRVSDVLRAVARITGAAHSPNRAKSPVCRRGDDREGEGVTVWVGTRNGDYEGSVLVRRHGLGIRGRRLVVLDRDGRGGRARVGRGVGQANANRVGADAQVIPVDRHVCGVRRR